MYDSVSSVLMQAMFTSIIFQNWQYIFRQISYFWGSYCFWFKSLWYKNKFFQKMNTKSYVVFAQEVSKVIRARELHVKSM